MRRADGSYEHLDTLEISYLAICQKALKGNKRALFKALQIMEMMTPPDESRERTRNIVEPEDALAQVRAAFPEIDAEENRHQPPALPVALSVFRTRIEAELDGEEVAEGEGLPR